MNTKEVIDVLHDLTHELGGNDRVAARMGAAALEREEKLRALIHHWKMLGELRFDEPIDAIEAILDGRAP